MKINERNLGMLEKFVAHCVKELGLTGEINIKLLPSQQEGLPTAGSYDPTSDIVRVSVKNRAIADCLRTIAHELTHKRQRDEGTVFPEDDDGLQPLEDAANVSSGKLVRFWGRSHPEIYSDLK